MAFFAKTIQMNDWFAINKIPDIAAITPTGMNLNWTTW
jgi:hypothetical protein